MTYKDLVSDSTTRNDYLIEEFGISERDLPERVVVAPIQYESMLPKDFTELLFKKGFKVEEYRPGDLVIRKIGKNYVISSGQRKFALLLLGRGVVEFSDRIYLLSTSPRVKDILFIGTAASLNPEVPKEDINIPELVIPFENVSALHVDVNRAVPRADRKLHRQIIENLKKHAPTKVHSKIHATVTLFYQETRELLEYMRDLGVATIDMELSAFYRISRFYGKRSAAILRIADMPLQGIHILSEKYRDMRESEKERTKETILNAILDFGFG